MSSRQKLQIVDVIENSGISQRTGKPYTMRRAQCVLHQQTEEGEQCVVGTIFLPDSLKEHGRGEYLASFAFAQSREGELTPRIVSLEPFTPVRPTAKSAASAAASPSA